MRKLLLLTLLLACLTLQAQTLCTVDRVMYLIEDDKAIIARQDKNLSGDLIIPDSISHDGRKYGVTGIVNPTSAIGVADCTFWCEGGAFQETQVHSVVLPESITYIPMGTFSDAPQLESVEIKGAVTELMHGTFSRSTGLSEVILPETLEVINVFAFGDCTSLESFDFPPHLRMITEGAFKRSGVRSIDLPASVAWIGDEAFGETPLRSVTLHYMDLEGKECAATAFNEVTDCELLVRQGSITIFENELPWSEFSKITGYDDGNEEIILSNKWNVTVDGIRYTLFRDSRTAMISRQNGAAEGDIVIPATISHDGIGYTVASIIQPSTMGCCADGSISCENGAFQDCPLTSISLPEGITDIPVGAFYNCQELKKVALPMHLKVIEAGAFAYCYSLEEIELPESLTDLGSASFGYGYSSFVFGECQSLKSIIIPSGVTVIADGCFLNSGIETLELPENVRRIGDFAIWTNALKELRLHTRDILSLAYSDRSIGNISGTVLMIPSGCKSLYSELYPWMDFASIEEYDDGGDIYVPEVIITLIDSVRYILDLENLVATVGRQNKDMEGDVVIPDKVEYAGTEYEVTGLSEPTFAVAIAGNEVDTEGGAFQSTGISSISLPATISTIPAGTFRECHNLTKVTLAEGLTSIGGGAFSDCTSLEEIYLPESLQRLSSDSEYGPLSYVFGGCTSLKKVNIPEGVTSIPGGCFKYSGLNSFIITDNISILEPDCFDLPELEYVKMTHKDLSDMQFTESVFPENIEDVTLLVPEGSKELYSQFYPWKDFGNIEEYKECNDQHDYNCYRRFIQWIIKKAEEIYDEITDENLTDRNRKVMNLPQAQSGNDADMFLEYVPSGKSLETLKAPEIEGLKFVRWEELPSHMPSEDVLLHAVYAEDLMTSVNEIGLKTSEIVAVIDLQGNLIGRCIDNLPAGIYIVGLRDGSRHKIFLQ